jgi:hypothetical protein
MARRAGIELVLDDLDAVARRVPVLANVFPSGDRLMEDFYYAGGLPALMNRIGDQLSLGELTVTGRSLGENIAASVVQDDEVIRPLDRPVSSSAALVVLRGNLAPEGAVMKGSAADARFFKHRGRALVFDCAQALSAGQEVFHSADPGQPAGQVALAAPSAEGGWTALVEVKLAALESGSLHAGSVDGAVLLARALPYALPTEPA